MPHGFTLAEHSVAALFAHDLQRSFGLGLLPLEVASRPSAPIKQHAHRLACLGRCGPLIFSQTNAQRLALFGVSVRFQSSRQAQVQAWPSVGTSDQLLILRCNGALNVANLCLDNIAVLLTPDHVRDNIADAKSLVRLVLH
jgi:hypothetical protein